MRLEIYLCDRVHVAALYATDGRLLGKGHATTEEGARYSAAIDMIDRISELKSALRELVDSCSPRAGADRDAPCDAE